MLDYFQSAHVQQLRHNVIQKIIPYFIPYTLFFV